MFRAGCREKRQDNYPEKISGAPGEAAELGLLQGPGVAKLSPSAIWGLSRKRCSETVSRRGESRCFPGQDLGNFPEERRSRESSVLLPATGTLASSPIRFERYGQMAPGDSFADTGGEFVRAVGEAGFPPPRVPILARLRLVGRFREFATSVFARFGPKMLAQPRARIEALGSGTGRARSRRGAADRGGPTLEVWMC